MRALAQLHDSLFHFHRGSYREEADLDSSSPTRSHPEHASDDPSLHRLPPVPSSRLVSAQGHPAPTPSSDPASRTAAASANIESSAAPVYPNIINTPAQVLGRRRRSPSDSRSAASGYINIRSLIDPPSQGEVEQPHPKRHRGEHTTMLSDGDGALPSNGGLVARPNGAAGPSAQHTSQISTPNGHDKAGLGMNGSSNGERRSSTYFGHNREEVTRLLIQALSDLGYQEAAGSVSRDSGYVLESPTVASFRSAVLSGSWAQAEQLLLGASDSETNSRQGNGLVLSSGSDRTTMRCSLRQQKFLELLEQRNTTKALSVLREELTPLYNDTTKLHFLSSLLMCHSFAELKAKTKWDGAHGESRKILLSQLSKCISPSVMLPENRLATLLQQVKQSQINTCLYHTEPLSPSLYSDHSCRRDNFPTECALELGNLDGEVWQVKFSPDGSMLAACGSAREVYIWGKNFNVFSVLGHHGGGVGNISWSPDSSMIVTCSQDKQSRLWDLKKNEPLRKSQRYGEPAIGCVWIDDGQSYVIGTLDINRSLTTYNVHNDEYIDWNKKHRVQDLCGSPDGRWLVAVDDNETIHLYNAITRELIDSIKLELRPTSISISQDSQHLLVNRVDGEAQLINLATRQPVQKFLGHTGGKYMIRSSLGGANESFVISGSEDGNILIWHKVTGGVVERLQGHRPRCNAVDWKPDDPAMLASCGDDGKVRIWTSKARARPVREDDGYYFVNPES
ncbi:unnamed protein product [Clonostachys solani]|uniref:CTLH domain-containing protein n=1 Tax=Clonostachys solani TaxID=160281 RepID=A0A9P0EL29_9HYPO|nr:unnamed protein product [Clonostachys solani]